MKRKTIINSIVTTTAASFLVVAGVSAIRNLNKGLDKTEAASLPTTIDLNDCSETEIKNYYLNGGLSGKSSSELTGTNLLKNLKAVLQKDVQYYSYNDASKIYVITDRDWTNSPASGISGYNSSTNKITSLDYSTEVDNNPYLHLLYCNYAVQGKTLYKGDGDVNSSQVSFDKEHAWSQSHGFDNGTSSGQNLTGAGSDLHHLKAGTQYGNRTLHSNYSYGFVKANDGDWSSKTYETLNKRGAPLFSHSGDQQTKVFEPQDSDKGDIARALLYMVACYNNYDGSTPTPANPALQLVNYVISGSTTGYSSDNLTNGYYGVLQDILAWHHMDPVDEYEIHRNNIIYRNYQNNRNPFIDYPEWVDYIWGVSTYNSSTQTISYDPSSTGCADLDEDVINGYRGSARTLESIAVTTPPTRTTYYAGESFDKTGMVVTATYDDLSTQDVTNMCTFSVDMSTAGNKNVTITYKGKSTTTPITVQACTANVESVTLNKSSATIGVGDNVTLTATVLPINAANKNINWSSSDTAVATVSDGLVTATGVGEATITAASAADSSITATFALTVRATTPKVTVTDTLTREDTGISGNTYGSWSNVTKSSGTVYSGISSGRNSVISINANQNAAGYAGIISTSSVGVLKKVSFEWQANTESGRIVEIYGSDTAYNAPAELVESSTQGTLIGTIVYGTSTELTVTDEYAYVGIRATGGNAYLTSVSIQWEKETTSEEISVTGVSLNTSSVSLGKGETTQLVASVQPAEATDPNVDFSSDTPSVAMVTSEGLVTAIEAGTAIITVTTEDGGFTASCTVTVTASSVGTNYYQKQTSTSAITSGNYVICANVNGTYYPMGKTFASSSTYYLASTTPISVTSNSISEVNASDYVVSLVVSGSSVAIKLSDTKYLTYGSSSTQITSKTTAENWTLSEGVNGTFRLTSSTENTRCLAYSVQTTSRFAAYSTSSVVSGSSYYDLEFFKYVEGTGSYTVDNFVEEFLGNMTCDASGANEPTFASGFSWSVFKTKYNSLTDAEKLELKNLTGNAYGNNKEKCVARYDYIVSKYGTAKYENFMNRTIISNSNVLTINLFKNGSGYLALYITITALGLITVGGFFIYHSRKKKEQ